MDEEVMEHLSSLEPEAPAEGSTTVPAEGQPQGTETTPEAPEFMPDQWKLNYKGQPVMPKDREHLVNLAQKGYGYEQRMEQLNASQKEMEEMKAKYGQYEELDKHFKENPEFQQQVMALRQQQGTPQATAPPVNPQMQSDMDEMKQWKQTLVQQQEDQKVTDQINGLKEKYPNHQWDMDDGNGPLWQKIIRHALDKNIDDLHIAYRDFFFDDAQRTAGTQALKKNAEHKQSMTRQGIVEQGAPAPAAKPAGINYSKSSYNDLTGQALKELR